MHDTHYMLLNMRFIILCRRMYNCKKRKLLSSDRSGLTGHPGSVGRREGRRRDGDMRSEGSMRYLDCGGNFTGV